MSVAGEFGPDLIERLRRGDEDAMRQVFARYYERLVRQAATSLDGRPRAARDEEDLAQSALGSFWNAMQAGRLQALNDPQSLERLLMKMLARKAVDWLRYESAEKRGGGHVRGDSGFPRAASVEDSQGSIQVPCDSLAPDAHVSAEEWWQHLFDLLPDDDCRRIVREKLDGVKNREIADRLGCSLRHVERRLQLVRSLWEHVHE
jgi:RNA polymerase sigma factor (sigma-70 family)